MFSAKIRFGFETVPLFVTFANDCRCVRQNKRVMKKYWGIITVLLAVGLAVFFYFRFYFVFGEGVKSGGLNYVVYKGLVFKTYEGKLIQTGIRSKAPGRSSPMSSNFRSRTRRSPAN